MKTLVIMAAGMGSRFGGVKQLEPLGPNGEIIINYSVYDAIEAGFDKIVYIIRKEIEADFKEFIGDKMSDKIEVEYVIQDLKDLPDGFCPPPNRTKPWGTGHAILACRDVVEEPFAVITADDYYGKEGINKISKFLEQVGKENSKGKYCMAGFRLGNTLSDNGTVTRGVCSRNEQGLLTHVEETYDIAKKGDIAIGYNDDGDPVELELDNPVSMNMWGFSPDFIDVLSEKFVDFLKNVKEGDLKAEYLLPNIVGQMLKDNKATVTVLDSNDKWFGITYKEDTKIVKEFFAKLAKEGTYPEKLF